MNTKSGAPTAKIYQFPKSTSGKLDERGPRSPSSTERRDFLPPPVEFGSGWYHQAAIDADIPRKS